MRTEAPLRTRPQPSAPALRRLAPASRWPLSGRGVALLAVVGCLFLGAWPSADAQAKRPRVSNPPPPPPQPILIRPLIQHAPGWEKLAPDLKTFAKGGPSSPDWLRSVNNTDYVRLLVVGRDEDPELKELRAEVLRLGGSVYQRFISVPTLTVMLPAGSVTALARRNDVVSVSPDRTVASTWSTLQAVTGLGRTRLASALGSPGDPVTRTGRGIGIAIVDSGVAWNHRAFRDADGASRVADARDFTRIRAALRTSGVDWVAGLDLSEHLVPAGSAAPTYLAAVDNRRASSPDPYGHGTHVAAVAAGRGDFQSPDSTGMAPNARLFDVRVIDALGRGRASDVLAGIDWVICNAEKLGIRVMNLSIGANATESHRTDPLARAVRTAVSQGIVVVAAAGNYGMDSQGRRSWGSISSPGHEPSAITVGAVNFKGTTGRGDDVVTNFSSRGPTRGSLVDYSGKRYDHDNLIKPDLVAPGNRVVAAMSTQPSATATRERNALALRAPELAAVAGAQQTADEELMSLSGTSVAAPVVAGAAAALLEANPGLTPALVKAILQYTAQALPGAGLLEQGAGSLNIEGALRLAGALRTDMAERTRGSAAGMLDQEPLLRDPGKPLPNPISTFDNEMVRWSRIVFAGGNRILSGEALFTRWQQFYDPRVQWTPHGVQVVTLVSAKDQSGAPVPRLWTVRWTQPLMLVTPGAITVGELAGTSSLLGRTGLFTPTATLSSWASSGKTLGLGVTLAAQGLILSEGLVMSEGLILSEGLVMSEGLIMSESLRPGGVQPARSTLVGEP